MWVKQQKLGLDMKHLTESVLGKEYFKDVYCHPAYLTHMQSSPCKTLGWMNQKLESSLSGERAKTSDMQMTTLMVESEKELYSLLIGLNRRVKKLA